MIELGKPSFVSFGGVDITADVEKFTIEVQRAADSLHAFSVALKAVRFTGRSKLTPYGYRALFGQSHPRIQRMHSAYSRRRGRGRW